ncbi:hypothetical protein [Nereida sp. MMG025]|uniref:hypothetical protein n=1 Tax=Nereida sp. MMG025 TaxID=2909981 RepID=UPI001F19418F|nr:hypothetical protein [Nereida sp. MMG025]MCF6446047.1 hypothetical protein [Nereida sp. MMG025]
MVNVAAATGVATGNFYNFTRWVLREGGIFEQRPEFEDVVLIRPERIRGASRAMGPLQERFGVEQKADGEVVRKELPDVMFPEPNHPRKKYFVKYVGKHLVDYPTPISSLSVSRQYLEFSRYVQESSEGFEDADFPSYEDRLIDIYFKTLEDLAKRDLITDCDWGRVKIMGVEEALEYLAT